MRWLLDTNVWIDAHAGQADAGRVFDQARAAQGAWIGFSAMTRLEALGYSSLSAADDKALRELLAHFEEVPVLPAVIEEAIRIRRLHRLKSPDAIVAATALLQQAEIITRNTTDFKKVTGLSVRDTQSF
jgi:predicted nucleic acid-binding protein